MSVGSDSGYTAGNVENLMTHIGYINSDNEPVITTLINTLDAVNSETQMVELLNDSNSNLSSIKLNSSDIAVNTLGISTDTQSINGKLTSSNTEDITNALQTVVYARHKNPHIDELGALNITTGHNLCVSLQDLDGATGQATVALSLPVTMATDQPDINFQVNSFKKEGSHNNINNDTTITQGSVSTLEANISNMRDCNVIYSDNSTASYDSVNVGKWR